MTHTRVRESSARLADLYSRERTSMVEFMLELAEFHRRRDWVEMGYASLFAYLHRELGMSKTIASGRYAAAGLLIAFPQVAEPLRDGCLCVTTLIDLARVMTPENTNEVLPRFFHCSKREAMVVAATIAPREAPPERDVISRVLPGELPSPGEPASRPPQPKPDTTEPLTAKLHRLHVTVSSEFVAQLDQAKSALSHKIPGATLEDILAEGLRLILREHARRKGLTDKPRAAPTPPKSASIGDISSAVKREVWVRDQGKCQWPLHSGGVCGSTLRVEYGHIISDALGGPAIAANIRLECRFHNQLEAQQTFGKEWMAQFRRTTRAESLAATSPPQAS